MKIRKIANEPAYIPGYFAIKAIQENERRKANKGKILKFIRKIFKK